MKPPRIIAEIANSHEGEALLLWRTVAAVKRNRVEAVKFQVFRAADLYAEGHEHYPLFDRLAFDFGLWREVFAELAAAGIDVYCDVFAPEVADFCAECGIARVKIHSSDAFNDPLVDRVATLGFAEVLIGVGGLYAYEIARLVERVAGKGPARIVLMHGQQSYPTTRDGNNVEKIAWLARHFGEICAIGYADHSPGYSDDAIDLSRIALAGGADHLEKHVSLDVTSGGTDHHSAIDLDDLARFVASLAEANAAAPEARFRLPDSELDYRRNVIKRPARDGETGAVVYRRDAANPIPRGIVAEAVAVSLTAARPGWREVIAVIVVRLESHRLARKAFAPFGGSTILATLIDNIAASGLFDDWVVATTTAPSDDEIEAFCRAKEVKVYRGEIDDVAGRMVGAIAHCEALSGRPVSHFARMTGDNPFLIHDVHRAIGEAMREQDYDYLRVQPLLPGLNAEYFNADFFRLFTAAMVERDYSEYITFFVDNHRDEILMREIPIAGMDRIRGRYTIDWEADREFCEKFRAFLEARDIALPTVAAILEFEREVAPAEIFEARQKRPAEAGYRLRWGLGVGDRGAGS